MAIPPLPSPDYVPLIALVHRLNRELQQDMVRESHRLGQTGIKQSHNALFGTLDRNGSRAADMAAQAGITRQSMGEIVREMVDLGMVEMRPDPADRRAKLVTWTDQGLDHAQLGWQHIVELEKTFGKELGGAAYEQLRTALDRLYRLMLERRRD